MIVEQVRNETKQAHQALEKKVIMKIKAIHGKQDYVSLLRIFYGYFKSIEQLAQPFLNDSLVPMFSQRRNADKVIDDINYMGGDTSGLKTATNLPEVTNALQAMGAMYVLEGSTMGGKVITQMIMKCLDLPDTNGVSFFNGYGERTEMMWGMFVKTLDSFTADEAEGRVIVDAAVETFAKFEAWIDEVDAMQPAQAQVATA